MIPTASFQNIRIHHKIIQFLCMPYKPDSMMTAVGLPRTWLSRLWPITLWQPATFSNSTREQGISSLQSVDKEWSLHAKSRCLHINTSVKLQRAVVWHQNLKNFTDSNEGMECVGSTLKAETPYGGGGGGGGGETLYNHPYSMASTFRNSKNVTLNKPKNVIRQQRYLRGLFSYRSSSHVMGIWNVSR